MAPDIESKKVGIIITHYELLFQIQLVRTVAWTHKHVHTHKPTHIHTHTRTHTYTHTHTQRQWCGRA